MTYERRGVKLRFWNTGGESVFTMANKKKEFVYDPDKHVRIGEEVYAQVDLNDTSRNEIGMIHWMDQKLADNQAQLQMMQDGRTVAVQRLVTSLAEVEPVAIEAPVTG